MYSLIAQAPRFVAIASGTLIVLYAPNAWWSLPAWLLAAVGAGCRRL